MSRHLIGKTALALMTGALVVGVAAPARSAVDPIALRRS